jgi:glycosyltransferase involved in cell wall biosynthesis
VEYLRRAVQSALIQDMACETIVLDDASTDSTAAMMRMEFPSVPFYESEKPEGVCVQRNRGVRLAKGDIIVQIDDDSEFTTPSVVRQTVADFKHPRIAAVSIPHKDITISPELKTPTPPSPGDWVVGSFVGAACAFRRDVFLQLGGYRQPLIHGSEEREYCTHLLNFGFVTLLGTADIVHHYASPIRDLWLIQVLQRRNDLCHAIWNVPLPHLLYHLPGTILGGLRFALANGWIPQTLTGYLRAIPVLWRHRNLRRPISGKNYRLLRRLNRSKLLPMEEVCRELGPMAEWQGSSEGPRPIQFQDVDVSGNVHPKGSNS